MAEWVFIAGLFVLAAKELARIAAKRGLKQDANQCLAEAAKMEQVILQHGWDGAWFVRAYDDFGKPIGSKACDEGKIFIESQGICIMAGIGLKDGKAKQALDSVNGTSPLGTALCSNNQHLRSITLKWAKFPRTRPGYKENAGIFCHNNPWIILALLTRSAYCSSTSHQTKGHA